MYLCKNAKDRCESEQITQVDFTLMYKTWNRNNCAFSDYHHQRDNARMIISLGVMVSWIIYMIWSFLLSSCRPDLTQASINLTDLSSDPTPSQCLTTIFIPIKSVQGSGWFVKNERTVFFKKFSEIVTSGITLVGETTTATTRVSFGTCYKYRTDGKGFAWQYSCIYLLLLVVMHII